MSLSFTLSSPVNTAFLLYILYYVQRVLFPRNSVSSTPPTEFKGGYSWMPPTHPPTLLYTTYTPRSLERFNGRDHERILLAINGIVFDVTAGKNFYGPGAYRDPVAARGCALTALQTACTATLRAETPRAAWRSNRSTSVRRAFAPPEVVLRNIFSADHVSLACLVQRCSRPLTSRSTSSRTSPPRKRKCPLPIANFLLPLPATDRTTPRSENMRGWLDHFTNKYIVCGHLVNNDSV